MDKIDRERWRKVNWGYSEEFIQAEKEYLGIALEPPQLEYSQVDYLIKRLDKQQVEIAGLRVQLAAKNSRVVHDRL
jgi:hypothetical protein